jgi:catechol 2,3-dioxygenase-like lactoylglutathione lyase family enzyme
MSTALDHMILTVNDLEASVAFYRDILGFEHQGQDGPFTVLRVSGDLILQLAPWGTPGGHHLAFAMSGADFDHTFERVRSVGLEFGDSFDTVGNMLGPGHENGARGGGPTVYFFDPNGHLIEIRHYDR